MTGFQLKLLAGVAALTALAVLAAGTVAERRLRARETQRIEASLLERARLVLQLVGETPVEVAERERLQPLVLGDSILPDTYLGYPYPYHIEDRFVMERNRVI